MDAALKQAACSKVEKAWRSLEGKFMGSSESEIVGKMGRWGRRVAVEGEDNIPGWGPLQKGEVDRWWEACGDSGSPVGAKEVGFRFSGGVATARLLRRAQLRGARCCE